ncbi:MAG TPA: tetratricopeptide repeat protein [Myxococcota bacterium]|nr:tetratricopeptide repeat protein [Myxococcota bacterium]HPB50874.1 tetratricopeptide repeat protein [Myxococcota bacterium]HQP95910.1 tetratricopeptide repeat protein [Myxococcota bacterium]
MRRRPQHIKALLHAMVAPLALFLVSGCATTGTNGKTVDSVPAIPACPEGFGSSLAQPIDAAPLVSSLRGETLVCPGGAVARRVMDDFGGWSVTSSEQAELLITVRCPGRDIAIHVTRTDEDRKTPSCIPAPLTLLDSRAAELVAESTRELAAGRFKRALALARKAIKFEQDSEAALIALGTAQMATGAFKDAQQTFSDALEINAGNWTVRLARAVCMSETGNKSGYAAEIFRLYDEVPVSAPLHWDLTCRMADNFNRIGNRDEAIRMARVACEHGVDMCCDLAHSDIEAREVR